MDSIEMTPEDKIQREAFISLDARLGKGRNYGTLVTEISDMAAFQIDVPIALESYLRLLMDEHNIDPNFNQLHHTSREGTVTLSLDHEADNIQSQFQIALMQNGVPMTVYMSNDQEHWVRSEFRWIDGKYSSCSVDYLEHYVDVSEILTAFELDALEALKAQAIQKEVLTRPIPFYPEDIAYCKPLALKAICGSV